MTLLWRGHVVLLLATILLLLLHHHHERLRVRAKHLQPLLLFLLLALFALLALLSAVALALFEGFQLAPTRKERVVSKHKF
jgi:predicted PurR-regulated permease PerM